MSIGLIDALEQQFRDTVTAHAPELQRAADIAAKVDASPLASVVLGLVHVPASIQSALAETLTQADAEFASLQPAAPEPPAEAPAEAPVADTAQATPEESVFGSESEPGAPVDPQPQTGVAV